MSPTLWTMAGMANSGNPSGGMGITCRASMQLRGTCNALAISCDGCANCAFTNCITISWPSIWNKCSGVVNLLAGMVSFCRAGIAAVSSSRAVTREVALLVDDPACDPEDIASLAGWCLMVTWKPSPLAMTWWGRKVKGMSCQPNVTVHSWYLHMSAASAASAISNPLTWGSKDAATEYMSKAPGMFGKTVTSPANLSHCKDCVITRSMIKKLFLGDLGGSGWITVTSNHSSGLIWSTQMELNCASQPCGGPTSCKFRGAVHLLMVAWSMYHVRTGTSKSPSKMSYPIRKKRVDRSSTKAGCIGGFGLGTFWLFPACWGALGNCDANSAIGLSWSKRHDHGCTWIVNWCLDLLAGRGAYLGWSSCGGCVARHLEYVTWREDNLVLRTSCVRWPCKILGLGPCIVNRSQWWRHVAQTGGTWNVLPSMSVWQGFASWLQHGEGFGFRKGSQNTSSMASPFTKIAQTEVENETWRDLHLDTDVCMEAIGPDPTCAKLVPNSCATWTARW